MKYIIFTFSFLFSTIIIAQDLNLAITNKVLVGNTWSFNLEMTVVNANGGNWGAMNVRNNIEVPDGITIAYESCTITNVHPQILNGGISNFTGGNLAGTTKLSLNIERNVASANLSMGTTITLGTFNIVFSGLVPGSNIITPRPFAETGTGATFWVALGDPLATRLPFGLYPAQALPIYLHSFSANKLGERSAKLDWRTSSEINSSHFEIQRSTDGLEWAHLGDVAAAGNSTTTRAYDFIDDKLPLGRTRNQIFYYRLRMVDQDGAFKYSDIRGVNFNINDRGDVSIYPNPAAQFFNLDLTGIDFSIEEKATVFIYDMSGKLVRQKDIIGSGIEPINVSELPAEAYNVIIRHGDQQYSKRVIVTK